MNESMLIFVKEYEELFKTSNWTEIYKRLHEKIANGGFQINELDVGPFTLAMKDLGIYPHLNPNMTELPWAYLRHTDISSFKLPSHIKVIGPGAFLGCNQLKEFDINEGCGIISENAFYSCDKLSSITFPTSLFHIGDEAFKNCDNLREIIFLGNNLTFIGNKAFTYSAVEELYLPHGLTTLGDRAFLKNKNLKTLSLPDTLDFIGESCFGFCENLTTVEMKLDKITFGKKPFGQCKSLETITHRGPKAEVIKARWPNKVIWRESSFIKRIQCDDGVIEL